MAGKQIQPWKRLYGLILGFLIFFSPPGVHAAAGKEQGTGGRPILVGLDADMTSGSAQSGVAIRRGIELAIDEINARGGILGRPVALVVRDHRGNPARGIDNIVELAGMPGLVAVVGGLHTPVALAELPAIHEHRVIYLGPWAAGTPVVDNGYAPNFVFRVSVRDAFAGGFLIDRALAHGFRRPGLLLENTGWGRSNEKAMKAALARHGLTPAAVQWFNWGSKQFEAQLAKFDTTGCDVILLVANAPEGSAVMNAIAALPEKKRLPVISHWGITGGNFFEETRVALQRTDLSFLQTFSFTATRSNPRTAALVQSYIARYDDCDAIEQIKSPVGTAHAYDLVHLLALAVEAAGSIDRHRVRNALERIEHYRGLVRDYAPPFSPERHDALDANDFHLARYARNGTIVRIEEK